MKIIEIDQGCLEKTQKIIIKIREKKVWNHIKLRYYSNKIENYIYYLLLIAIIDSVYCLNYY